MSDIVYESENDFKLVKVELGDDKEWKDRYMVNAFLILESLSIVPITDIQVKKEAGLGSFILLINRDLLQFVVNRTNDGILRVNDYSMITYLKDHGNAISIGLVNPDVIRILF